MTTVPKGFSFAVAAAGFKRADRNDLALIVSDRPCTAAGVFTTNKFQAAPVLVCKRALQKSPSARAVLVNSGQANACTGEEGLANCRATLEMVGKAAGIEPGEILPASTGVIGAQLKMDRWAEAAPKLVANIGQAAPTDAARAIMTTDTFPKLVTRSVELPGGVVNLLGMCKGAGMICPTMATMLGFVICDAEMAPGPWREMLKACADKSFNALTVDGDTSTNDTLLALANGASGVRVEDAKSLRLLKQAMLEVCQELSYRIVQDAEGGTKVAHITVSGAKSPAQAEAAARAIGNSPWSKQRCLAVIRTGAASFAPWAAAGRSSTPMPWCSPSAAFSCFPRASPRRSILTRCWLRPCATRMWRLPWIYMPGAEPLPCWLPT